MARKKTEKEIAADNSITEGQLRDWAREYKASDERALEDRRENRKDESELSQEGILKRRLKELEDKNKRLKAEQILIIEREIDINNSLKYLVIKEVAIEFNYSIKFLCEVWKVNRRNYYKWLKRTPTTREKEAVF